MQNLLDRARGLCSTLLRELGIVRPRHGRKPRPAAVQLELPFGRRS